MSTFYYTDKFDVSDSSVLRDVYYDSHGELLIVRGLSGFKAGYIGVDRDTFVTFAREAQYYSAGAYWNSDIKNHFEGWNTSHIDNFEPMEEVTAPPAPDAVPAVEQKESHFVIFWRDGETTLEQSVVAADEESALLVFDEIMELAGFENAEPAAVVHFL